MISYDYPISYSALEGWPDQVESALRRKLGQISRHQGFHQKVGITNSPENRWKQAYAGQGWQSMIVIYKSRSHSHVADIERRLIDWFEYSSINRFYYNQCGGGGGRIGEFGPYYVYVVNRKKYAKLCNID